MKSQDLGDFRSSSLKVDNFGLIIRLTSNGILNHISSVYLSMVSPKLKMKVDFLANNKFIDLSLESLRKYHQYVFIAINMDGFVFFKFGKVSSWG